VNQIICMDINSHNELQAIQGDWPPTSNKARHE